MKKERFLIPLLLILIWQGLSSIQVIPSYKLPSPIEIILGFKDLLMIGVPPGHLLHNHILYSLYRVALGYAIAALLAIPLGLLMGWSSGLLRMVRPLFELIRPIPPLAWIPIAILWFGIGIKSAAFIIFLGAFFPILLNTISGVLSIHPILIEAARTLHASERDIFLKVLFPGASSFHLCGNANWYRYWMDDTRSGRIYRCEGRLWAGLYDHDRPGHTETG